LTSITVGLEISGINYIRRSFVPFNSINPANGEILDSYPNWSDAEIESSLAKVSIGAKNWANTRFEQRANYMRATAEVLRKNKSQLSQTISLEMGKLLKEAEAEVEKSALGLEFYADHAEQFLAPQMIKSDASKSYVAYQPLGCVLAIMPWNFPLWQVFRFAAPALMAGNTAILKHASNVPQCALAIENCFIEAGLPEDIFRSFMITSSQVAPLIADPRIHAVTITGSTPAGSSVASQAGKHLKKSVLELGGSDPFIVLNDADLDLAVKNAVASRYMNCGQSCIAAKRFIVVNTIADQFLEKFTAAVEELTPGDPQNAETKLAPMARHDLRDELHTQVETAISQGANVVTGCQPIEGPGAFYTPSIIDNIDKYNLAYSDELFGPVATVIRVQDDAEAVSVANDTEFGLGGSIWTRDNTRGEQIALQLESGSAFVNGMVKSDPRLPFGGIKTSGYGRELSHEGIKEFVNTKTIWIR